MLHRTNWEKLAIASRNDNIYLLNTLSQNNSLCITFITRWASWLNVFFFKPRLHDTTCCQTGCQSGLTNGCIVYTNIQPVVKPVWQPVWQPAVSCIQPVRITHAHFVKDSIISRVLIRLSFSDLGTEWSWKLCTCLTGIRLLKLGKHYPCPRDVSTVVNTARGHG